MKRHWFPSFKIVLALVFMAASASGAYARGLSEDVVKYQELKAYAETQLDKTIETGHLSIHYPGDSIPEEEIELLANEHEKKFNQIAKDLGVDFRGRVEVFLYPPDLEDEIWEARRVFSDRSFNEIHCYYNGMGDHGHITHDLVHIISFELVTDEEVRRISPLLKEGLAEYLAGRPWGRSVDEWTAGFLKEGKIISLDRLRDPDFFKDNNPVLTYTEAASFVKFLIENYGMEKFKEAYSKNSFASVYGKPLAQLEEQWLKHLSRIEPSEEDLELFNYRLWLGRHYQETDTELKPLPWLGIEYSTVPDGIVITDVMQDSPAHQAGLKEGDIVARVDGLVLDAGQAWRLNSMVQTKQIGERVCLVIKRDGKLNETSVVLGSRPGW